VSQPGKKDVDARDKRGHDGDLIVRDTSSVIASEAKQSMTQQGEEWIASSLRSSQ
jgi:hypothetical protein